MTYYRPTTRIRSKQAVRMAVIGMSTLAITFSSAVALPHYVLAQQVSASTAVQRQQLANLQGSANNEINRRLASLNAANDLLKNSSELKSDVLQDINAEIAGEIKTLVDAQHAIQAASNITDAQTGVNTVQAEYPKYVLAARKGLLLGSADFQLMVEKKVAKISVKMENRMNAASDVGTDVSSIQTVVSDLQSHLQTAQSATQPVVAAVPPIAVGQYEANQAVMAHYQSQLELAHKNLQNCETDINQLVPLIAALK